MALDFLGISPALLTISLIMLAIILLLIFVFIFLGIQAFALGGTFGAVVNSMLPMGIIFILKFQLLEVVLVTRLRNQETKARKILPLVILQRKHRKSFNQIKFEKLYKYIYIYYIFIYDERFWNYFISWPSSWSNIWNNEGNIIKLSVL